MWIKQFFFFLDSTRGDYSSIDRREKALTGWRRYFSSVTKEGRVNVSFKRKELKLTEFALNLVVILMPDNYCTLKQQQHELLGK